MRGVFRRPTGHVLAIAVAAGAFTPTSKEDIGGQTQNDTPLDTPCCLFIIQDNETGNLR
jgi:hypothetical protein